MSTTKKHTRLYYCDEVATEFNCSRICKVKEREREGDVRRANTNRGTDEEQVEEREKFEHTSNE
jgi:hypothetical protein